MNQIENFLLICAFGKSDYSFTNPKSQQIEFEKVLAILK